LPSIIITRLSGNTKLSTKESIKAEAIAILKAFPRLPKPSLSESFIISLLIAALKVFLKLSRNEG